ncbi:MAG: hypothetical protein ACI9NT_000120 [Bacteroidia bacterium]|jgi:hypothetical protein
MVIKKIARGGLVGAFIRWSSNLRFPALFFLITVLFVSNLLIPDVVPFVDEIIMGLVAALLASLRKKPVEEQSAGTGD